MVPGSFRTRTFHRFRRFRGACRPPPRIRNSFVKLPMVKFDTRGYMERQNFIVFQERMCVVFQLSMIMFYIWILCGVIAIFMESTK